MRGKFPTKRSGNNYLQLHFHNLPQKESVESTESTKLSTPGTYFLVEAGHYAVGIVRQMQVGKCKRMYQGTVSLSIILHCDYMSVQWYVMILWVSFMGEYMFMSFHGFVCIIILAVVFSGQFLDPPWAYESWPQWPQDYKNPPKMAKRICEFQVNHFTIAMKLSL